MTPTPTPPPPPWGVALHSDRCNFHLGRKAVATYAGTPLCDACAGRLGWPPPGDRRAA